MRRRFLLPLATYLIPLLVSLNLLDTIGLRQAGDWWYPTIYTVGWAIGYVTKARP